jgi:hypothetical protein
MLLNLAQRLDGGAFTAAFLPACDGGRNLFVSIRVHPWLNFRDA